MASSSTDVCPLAVTSGKYPHSKTTANDTWVRRPGLLASFLTALLGLSLLGALTGCLPTRFVVDVSTAQPELREATVLKDPGGGDAGKIALIRVDGLIADAPSEAILGSGPNPVSELFERLERAERDPNVRAVIIRINSPGGTVTGSDIMHSEIVRFREKTGKPVIASMGEVAASGGYYIALGCDEIVAHPTTITASIGVLIQTINISEGLSMIGVKPRAVTSGDNKDMASPLTPMQEGQYAILQGLVDEYYVRFRSLVEDRRSEFSAESNGWAIDGRIMSGHQAAEIGLVDSLGDLRDAFERAKSLTGLSRARLVAYHRLPKAPETPYSPLAHADTENAPSSATRALDAVLLEPGAYYLWRP